MCINTLIFEIYIFSVCLSSHFGNLPTGIMGKIINEHEVL